MNSVAKAEAYGSGKKKRGNHYGSAQSAAASIDLLRKSSNYDFVPTPSLEMAADASIHDVKEDKNLHLGETEEERLLREHEEYVGTHDEAKAFGKKMQEKSQQRKTGQGVSGTLVFHQHPHFSLNWWTLLNRYGGLCAAIFRLIAAPHATHPYLTSLSHT